MERRGHITKELCKTIRERQRNLCAVCFSELSRIEHRGARLDHIISLLNGDTDAESNLQHLCSYCHDAKTQAEELARSAIYNEQPFRGLCSALSPDNYDIFMGPNASPPLLSGRYIPEDEKVNPKELISAHQLNHGHPSPTLDGPI